MLSLTEYLAVTYKFLLSDILKVRQIGLVFAVLAVLVHAAVLALITRAIYFRYFHPLSRYPGPFLASFSDLWKFNVYFGGKHHLTEQKLHEHYGNVVRVGPTSLSFSDLASYDAIYGFDKAIEKGDFYVFGRDTATGKENVFSARTDASHRAHRRAIVGPALTPGKIATYEPVISKHTSTLLTRLSDARSASKSSNVVDIAETMHRFALDTIVEIIYGSPLSSQAYTATPASAGILHGLRTTSKMSWGTSFLPWLGKMMATTRRPTKDADGRLTSIAALGAKTREVLVTNPELTLESLQPSIARNLLQVSEDDGKRMLPDDVWRECFNLTFAGPGSTSAALTSILYQLGTEQGRSWQARIRDEVGKGSSFTGAGPILMAVIKETMRLNAPFPTAFPRCITKGAENSIPGLPAKLPVGTVVSANSYILGHSTDVWGPDAGEWKPERWMVATEEKKQLHGKFAVFGKGARDCIGKDIALLMLSSAVVKVLLRWEVEADGEIRGSNFLEMQYTECGVSLTER